jgi:hypothetical protein
VNSGHHLLPIEHETFVKIVGSGYPMYAVSPFGLILINEEISE